MAPAACWCDRFKSGWIVTPTRVNIAEIRSTYHAALRSRHFTAAIARNCRSRSESPVNSESYRTWCNLDSRGTESRCDDGRDHGGSEALRCPRHAGVQPRCADSLPRNWSGLSANADQTERRKSESQDLVPTKNSESGEKSRGSEIFRAAICYPSRAVHHFSLRQIPIPNELVAPPRARVGLPCRRIDMLLIR